MELAKKADYVLLYIGLDEISESEGLDRSTQTCCESFAELHPEWDIDFVYGVADEATAATSIAQDPEAGADVFLYANDNITIMTDAQALAKFGGKYEEQIRDNASEAILNSVTMDGFLYGVPFTTNTWFMYYDKSVFTEEDIKSLETMLQKGVVSFPFTNSWYLPAFYFGNGCTLFGDGTQEELGADFGGDNAEEVTDYLVDLIKIISWFHEHGCGLFHPKSCGPDGRIPHPTGADPVLLRRNSPVFSDRQRLF